VESTNDPEWLQPGTEIARRSAEEMPHEAERSMIAYRVGAVPKMATGRRNAARGVAEAEASRRQIRSVDSEWIMSVILLNKSANL